MHSFVRTLLICTATLAAAGIGLAADAPAPQGKQLVADGAPLVRAWSPGVFPANAPSPVNTGTAVLRIIVDETGAVTHVRVLKASEPVFGDAALAAMKDWRFAPGIEQNKPVAMCVDVPFRFTRGAQPKLQALPPDDLAARLAPRTRASLADGPLGEYPPSLVGRGLPGSVIFRCFVEPDGKASRPQIVAASHADFVLPALKDFQSWRFKPAMQGDLPIATEMEGEVTYSDANPPARNAVLAANGITAPDGSVPSAAPQPVFMADPVWPYDLLMNGTSGSASVEFTVTPNGVVTDVQVRDATQPEFGAALAAAVATWLFDPAVVDGKGVEVRLLKKAEFKAVPLDAKDDSDWLPRLVALAREKAFTGGKGLDHRIVPLYRVAPTMPSDAPKDEKGQAVIEFVIDRDGRARLPRIVSATREAYGWAAATAISQWIFNPPTRAGQPTQVKVQIPIVF